ncbi:MAG: DUF839 domain-containing protein, partial [Acinetobacter sp.]
YEARVLYALGDPITSGLEEWDDSKIPTGASFTLRSGECHDGMTFFGMQNSTFNATTSDTGLLVMNHEYIDNPNILHPAGHTHGLGEDNIQLTTGLIPRVEDEALREINCHGVSVISVNKNPTTQSVNVDKSSNLNRRITAATPMDIRGPVKGNVLLQNRLSPEGTFSFG